MEDCQKVECKEDNKHAFNYQYQRLMIGITAMLIPLAVVLVGCLDLTSISASYHSDARDVFVGLLIAVGALMIPYQGKKGESKLEFWSPKAGGLGAMVVAFIPMECCNPDAPDSRCELYDCFINHACGSANSTVHLLGSIAVFVSLFLLCIEFRKRADCKPSVCSGIRKRVYEACMLSIIVGALIAGLDQAKISVFGADTVFWAETIMLESFGIAWLTASQFILWDEGKRRSFFPPQKTNSSGCA